MLSVSETVDLQAPADAVWKTLGDFGGAQRYLDVVKRCELAQHGSSIERVLHLKDGGSVRERLVLSSDDDRALPYRFGLKGLGPLGRRQRQPFCGGLARRVHVAGEADIAAQRQPAELPPGTALVGPAGDFPPEPDRKGLRLHAEPASGEIMTQLMDENERPDHEHKGNQAEQDARILGQTNRSSTRARATDRASSSTASTASSVVGAAGR